MQSPSQSLVEFSRLGVSIAQEVQDPGHPPSGPADPTSEASADRRNGHLGIEINTTEFHAFIEEWRNFRLRGWIVGISPGTIEIRASANGKSLEGAVFRQPRADVSAVFRTADDAPGFVAELPGKIWQGIPAEQDAAIEVFAGDHVLTAAPLVLTRARVASWIKEIAALPHDPARESLLKIAGEHIHYANLRGRLDEETRRAIDDVLARGEYHPEPKMKPVAARPAIEVSGNLRIETNGEQVRGFIEGCNHFQLWGWVVAPVPGKGAITLRADNKLVEAVVISMERADVAAAVPGADKESGFVIELPGCIWEGVADRDSVLLDVAAGAVLMTQEPLSLTLTRAAGWIRDIVRWEGGDKDRFMLLALEHLRYGGGLYGQLGQNTQHAVREFAARMRLEEYVFPEGVEESKVPDAPANSLSNLLLHDAMRALNSRLSNEDAQKSVYSRVMEVYNRFPFTQEARYWFLSLAIQVTCDSGEFDKLWPALDVSKLVELAKTDAAPHQLTLALPTLIKQGRIELAAKSLRQLAKQVHEGWMHTSCIRLATKMVQDLDALGEVDPALAEDFRAAFLEFVAGFDGEWFSRLHDRELIDAMLELSARLEFYNDDQQDRILASIVRHYGLCPEFWRRRMKRQDQPDHPELDRASQARDAIASALEKNTAQLIDQLDSLQQAFVYFLRYGNPEALLVLREVVLHVLPEINRNLTAPARWLIDRLVESDPSEAIRIGAFPLPEENHLSETFLKSPEAMLQTLRRARHLPRSDVYDLQRRAAQYLRTASHEPRRAPSSVSGSLAKLEAMARPLCSASGMYLGIDLLASAYAISHSIGLPSESSLAKLSDAARKCIAETAANAYLPAPVQGVIARLGRLPQSALLHRLIVELAEAVEKKFGSLNTVASAPDLCVLNADSLGWPGDTLVAIDSTRSRVESTIPTLEQSWVRDLADRQIRHLTLVGDGDDTLQDNLLAVGISDRREEKAHKTIRFFQWVLRNTDYQYVLKISDDCYLDVKGYFETLSYRKHHYYGSIVQLHAGTFDRTAHQLHSDSRRSKHSIDKSPETSIYVAGPAMCLSRFGIAKMLERARSEVGKRLIESSFTEDKLVGDLMALAGIHPSNEDHDAHFQSRTFPGAIPVSMLENTFFSSLHTPTKVVKFENEAAFVAARQRSRTIELVPKKIWPTYGSPSLKQNANQLELLTSPARATALLKTQQVVISVVRNEATILPHFLSHYRALGARCFIFIDNCSDDGSREYLIDEPDVVLYSSDTEYKHSHYGVAWQQAVLGNLCLGKWALLVDADEFLIYEDCETVGLSDFLGEIEREGNDGGLVYMIDMYPAGDLAEASFEKGSPFEIAPYFDASPLIEIKFGGGSFSNSRNFVSGLRHRIAPSRINAYVSQKYALFRYFPWIRLTEGIHYAANLRVTNRPIFLAHFKYHAEFKKRVLTEIRRNQHFNGAEEYRRYGEMLAKGSGSFIEAGTSQRYVSSRSFLDSVRGHRSAS